MRRWLATAFVLMPFVLPHCGGGGKKNDRDGGFGAAFGTGGGTTDGGAGTDGGGTAGMGAGGTSGGTGGMGNSGGMAGPDIPLEEVPERLAEAFCTAFEACSGPVLAGFTFRDLDCITLSQRGIEDGSFPNIEAGVMAGTINYEGTRLQGCLDAISGAGCAAVTQRTFAACEAAIAGTVDVGGDCTRNEDCSGANFCQVGASCPGTCTALLGDGEDCNVDDECSDGFFCTEGKCERPAALGELCGGMIECAPGLFCAGADEPNGIPGTCSEPATVFTAAANADCSLAGPLCAEGLVCTFDSIDLMNPANSVVQCQPPASAGSACKAAIPDPCPAGQYCSVTTTDLLMGTVDGTCTPLPQGTQPCADNLNGLQCAGGAVCIMDVCENLQRLDASCQGDEQCYSDACVNGTCATPDPCN